MDVLKCYSKIGKCCFYKLCKTLIRPYIVYGTRWAPVLRHGNWSVITKSESMQKGVTKIIKRLKDYCYRNRLLEKLGWTPLQERRMRGDFIETFKIINRINNYDRHISIFLLDMEIYCQDRFQTLSLQTNWIFCSSSSSSSSYHAASTDIPDPLTPLLPIIHRFWQVFRATSRILT